jgi:predicted esterase
MSARSHIHHFAPATTDGAPPLLLLHGTGGTELDLVPLAQRLAPGAAILSPRGRVSERGANRFFARLAEGVFDPAEVTQRTQELADFVIAAGAQHGVDPRKLIALGYSNGANIAATLLQLRPEMLAGAVLLRPMVVLDQAATAGVLTGRRVLIASGTADPLVPTSHPDRLAELLRAGGATVELHRASAGHQLTGADLTAAAKFLQNG